MVAIRDVTLSTSWYSRLPTDHIYTNKVVLGTGKRYGMVAHDNGVSYCWRGRTIGRAYALFSICLG